MPFTLPNLPDRPPSNAELQQEIAQLRVEVSDLKQQISAPSKRRQTELPLSASIAAAK